MTLQELLNRLNRIALENPSMLDQQVNVFASEQSITHEKIGMVVAFESSDACHAHITIFTD